MNALVMMISNPAFRIPRTALESALHVLPVDKVYIGLAPPLQVQGWAEKLKQLTKLPLVVVPGAATWDQVVAVKFALFDRATKEGAKWLIALDDDDGVLGCPTLSRMPDDVGAWHTDIIAVCRAASGFRKPGDVFLRRSSPITRSADANLFRGSFYGYRAEAWAAVSALVDRSYTDYEEWRVVWHMLRAGWKVQHVPRVLQWQGVKDFVADAELQQQRGRSWSMELGKLEAAFGDVRSTNGRWWQNWDIDKKRLDVEDFWRDDPAQAARREAWYLCVQKVLLQLQQKVVMDHGCGVAWDQPEFVRLGLEYHGADVTDGMLARARERVPGIDVRKDDVFHSKFMDNEWPLVTSGAVLPHLPKEKVPQAISELWRITKECLLIKLFGVDAQPKDETLILRGFIYNRLRQATWVKMIRDNCPGAREIKLQRPTASTAKDLMIVEVWR